MINSMNNATDKQESYHVTPPRGSDYAPWIHEMIERVCDDPWVEVLAERAEQDEQHKQPNQTQRDTASDSIEEDILNQDEVDAFLRGVESEHSSQKQRVYVIIATLHSGSEKVVGLTGSAKTAFTTKLDTNAYIDKCAAALSFPGPSASEDQLVEYVDALDRVNNEAPYKFSVPLSDIKQIDVSWLDLNT